MRGKRISEKNFNLLHMCNDSQRIFNFLRRLVIVEWMIMHPVAQRQEMVSGTLPLLSYLLSAASEVSRASVPKGDEVL